MIAGRYLEKGAGRGAPDPELHLQSQDHWTPEHCRDATRRGLRYPSDLTEAERVLVEPMIPPAKHGGRRREVSMREVLNGPAPGPSRSSNAMNCIASSFSPNAGSSIAPWLGSAAAGVSPKTSRGTLEKPLPSSVSP